MVLSTARSHSHTLSVATLGSKHQTGATQQLRQSEEDRERERERGVATAGAGQKTLWTVGVSTKACVKVKVKGDGHLRVQLAN